MHKPQPPSNEIMTISFNPASKLEPIKNVCSNKEYLVNLKFYILLKEQYSKVLFHTKVLLKLHKSILAK